MTRPATFRAEADQYLDDHQQAGRAADQSEQVVPLCMPLAASTPGLVE
jgi:hypothetical protein